MRLRDRKGRAILCLRLSSNWGLVGRCTRSAFRRTPSRFKNGNANLNVQFTLYVRTDFIISPSFDEWLISHSRATLAPLLLKVSLPHLIVILLHGPVMLS